MSWSPDEQRFMHWWEQNRGSYLRRSRQLWLGLPLGAAFALPILANFWLGRFWYRRADAVGSSQFNPLVLIFAVGLIAAFMAYISRRFKWEQYEEKYRQLRDRMDSKSADGAIQSNESTFHSNS